VPRAQIKARPGGARENRGLEIASLGVGDGCVTGDQASYIFVDLDFATTDEAQRFLTFLQDSVWFSAAASPALAWTPQTKLQQAASRSAGRNPTPPP
jgi:hypothetical protein